MNFTPILADSGGLKTHSVERMDLVEGSNLVCTSRVATSASLTRHQKPHLCIITRSLSSMSQLSSELFKKLSFLHPSPFLQILASHWQRPETCGFQPQSAGPASGQLLGIHWPSHAPLPEVPACSQQPTCPHQHRRGMNNKADFGKTAWGYGPALISETKLLFVCTNISF